MHPLCSQPITVVCSLGDQFPCFALCTLLAVLLPPSASSRRPLPRGPLAALGLEGTGTGLSRVLEEKGADATSKPCQSLVSADQSAQERVQGLLNQPQVVKADHETVKK